MRHLDEDQVPEEFGQISRLLHERRPHADAVELDRIKARALTQGSRSSAGSATGSMRSRVAAAAVVVGLVFGGTGVVLAGTGGVPGSGGSSGSAPNNQYCPPSSNSPGKPKGEPGGNKCGQPNSGNSVSSKGKGKT